MGSAWEILESNLWTWVNSRKVTVKGIQNCPSFKNVDQSVWHAGLHPLVASSGLRMRSKFFTVACWPAQSGLCLMLPTSVLITPSYSYIPALQAYFFPPKHTNVFPSCFREAFSDTDYWPTIRNELCITTKCLHICMCVYICGYTLIPETKFHQTIHNCTMISSSKMMQNHGPPKVIHTLMFSDQSKS